MPRYNCFAAYEGETLRTTIIADDEGAAWSMLRTEAAEEFRKTEELEGYREDEDEEGFDAEIDGMEVEEDEDHALLTECLSALNDIPNRRYHSDSYPDTYALAAALTTRLAA